MNITKAIKNNTLIISFFGELDEYTAGFTREYLDSVLSQEIYKDVILDMSGLEFMDSTGIGVLIGRYKKLKSRSKDIYISNPNTTIEKIFNMSGIYEIMPKIS